MRFLTYFCASIALYFCATLSVLAQEDDKGFLTRSIQDALSGAGRTVSINGFRGALSSAASFDRMTIADDDGIWMTLEDVALVWTRSALLRGRLEVESLTAKRLDLPRLPVAQENAVPSAEAEPFALPDLPVSIVLREFSIAEINLGAALLGEDAQLNIAASATYTDEVGDIDLVAERLDGKQGRFAIKANLERSDSILDLLLQLNEGEEGIAARVLNLPGLPSVDMNVSGSGPVDEFTTDLRIATDGAERLAGKVTVGVQPPRRASAAPDRRIQADIGGDVTALLAPRFREFFGEEVKLRADALIESTGAIELSDFALQAQAADLQGKITLNTDNWPTLIDISGRIANPDGTTILLPVGGDGTRVKGVDLQVDYDAQNGDAIEAAFDVDGLSLTGIDIDDISLGLAGTLRGDAGAVGAFAGDVTFDAKGLKLSDAALAEAVGSRLTGSAQVRYTEEQPIEIINLDLAGPDYGLFGDVVIQGVESGLRTALDARLSAQDLSRFSALAGQDLNGQTALALQGEVSPLSGQFDLTAVGTTDDLKLGIAEADRVLAGRTSLSVAAKRDETGTFLRDLVLENAALSLTGRAELRTNNSRAEAKFRLNDLGLVVPQYDGPITVDAVATQDAVGWRVDARTDGPYGAALTAKGLATGPDADLTFTADVPEMNRFVQDIDGPVQATGRLRNSADGWLLRTTARGPYQVQANIDGQVAPKIDVRFDMLLPDMSPLVSQVSGPLTAEGRLEQTQNGFVINTRARGPYDVAVGVSGAITPMVDVEFDLKLPDVRPLAPQYSGALAATGTVQQTEKGFVVDTDAAGPYGARASANGLATGPDMLMRFDLSMPNVAPVAPGISGPLAAKGVVRQTASGIGVETMATGPYASEATVSGVVTGPDANVRFGVAMPNIGALVDRINGPLRLQGFASKVGTGWQVQTDVDGPSGTQAQVAGTVAEAGTLNLDIDGTAPLGLSRPFLAPRDLQGLARFDLNLNGPPALSSLSGRIQTSDASLSAPNARLALQGIVANIQLGRNRAQLNMTGQGSNGGQVRAEGAVTLTGALPADITVGLDALTLIDPRLYNTALSGAIRVAGPLTGGARITGQVNVGETVVNVPSTGLTSIGDIPAITHIGATRPVMSTRRKAGLDAVAEASASANGGPGYGLDVAVNAPNRIFVRGRGLDAELGGGLRVTGTTNRIISAGQFELLRGRLSILGQRFDLVEGAIQFQGDLMPSVRFVSVTETSTGEVRVIVDGPVDEPEVSFEATPAAPQDEVLAQLLFGRKISEISPFQALQLASAVAELAGRGGISVISNLRDGFGLDDLDVTTTDSGATAVRAGKYISENIYTDVTAASDGEAEVSLNLDITSNLKGKATVGSDGNSGIGIFFEKDY